MADILHDFHIKSTPDKVFQAISSPEEIVHWWPARCEGKSAKGERYVFGWTNERDWSGCVTQCQPGARFEWEMVDAMPDWMGTCVGFELVTAVGGTQVRFHHSGWAEVSEHFRISTYCWAQYLHQLKRWVEKGESMSYEERLEL